MFIKQNEIKSVLIYDTSVPPVAIGINIIQINSKKIQLKNLTSVYINNSSAGDSISEMNDNLNKIFILDDIFTSPPTQYTQSTVLEVNENTQVVYNVRLNTDNDATEYNVTNLPIGFNYNSALGIIRGTAPSVDSDNITNSDDTYTMNIIKTNSQGSSTGTFTLKVINTTAPVTIITGFNQFPGSNDMVDVDTLNGRTVVNFDNLLQDGQRFIIKKEFIQDNIVTYLSNSTMAGVFIGIISDANNNIAQNGFNGLSDFDCCIELGNSGIGVTFWDVLEYINESEIYASGINIDFVFEYNGTDLYLIGDTYTNLTNKSSIKSGETFTRQFHIDKNYNTDITISIATLNTQCDISTNNIFIVDIPANTSSLTKFSKGILLNDSNDSTIVNNDSNSSSLINNFNSFDFGVSVSE